MHTVHHWSLFLFIYVILLFQKCCTPSPLAKNGRCHTTSLPLSYTPKVAIVEKFGHIMLINFIIPGIGHQMIEMLGICWGWHVISFRHQLKWTLKVHVNDPIQFLEWQQTHLCTVWRHQHITLNCTITFVTSESNFTMIGDSKLLMYNSCFWNERENKCTYYISWLVRALRLVNLAGRTLLYGPLKFKVDSVAKLFCDLSPTFFL